MKSTGRDGDPRLHRRAAPYELERLCCHIARPPIKVERLWLDADGRVVYALRHPSAVEYPHLTVRQTHRTAREGARG